MLRSSVKSLERVNRIWLRQIHNRSCSQTLLNQIIRRKPNGVHLSFMNSISWEAIVWNGVRTIHAGSFRLAATENSLDKSLHRIDIEIRRTGRVNRREIEEVLEEVRHLNSMTSNQSLMIIRCCGELVPEESLDNRTKLVQEVWKTMEKLKVPLDISHYNALLRVYLENEHKFNPSEFLQELSSKGLEPNRVTYQRLIARFCQEGDIDGASTILQHMKEKQLPINVHVFNALILGHAQAGDMESAEGIIGVMKQAGLEPNDDSYATLMRGYAKKGDLDNIKRIVSECEEKEIFLVDRDFLEVILTLASSNHADLVKDVIPLLKRHAGFNQEATNIILRLVTIGQEDVAFQLLKQMPRAVKTSEELVPSGNFFIRQLVASQTAPEKILKICHEMISTGLNKYALLKACEFSLQLRQFEKAFEFLEALKETGFPIRQHYFWPFFACSKSEKEVYDGLKCMSYMEVSPTVETVRDYIIPGLVRSSAESAKTYDFVLDKLSSYASIPVGILVPAAFQHILQNSKLDVAATFALKHRMKFNNIGIRRALVESYLRTRDANAFVQIVASSGFDGEDSAREAMGVLLMDLLESCRGQKKEPILLPILKECLKNGLGLSNSSLEWIQNNLGDELSPEVSNLIVQLTSGELTLNSSLFASPSRGFINYDERSTSELEGLLRSAVEAGKQTKGIRKALLVNYCRNEKNLEKAEALYDELQAENFVFTPGLYALMLDLYCHSNKLEKARDFYQRLSNRDFFVLDDLKLLRYALLLLTNDCYDECLHVLKSQARDAERQAQGVAQVALVWKILNACAEKGEIERVKELFNVLKERGLTPINNVVLGPLVKANLVKEDLEGAVKEFEACVNDYGVTPWKSELFIRLIKKDDAEGLQKVLDLSTKQHGEINSLYDLVFAFLECGKIRQAKKIVETPGFRARNEKLEFTCHHYFEEGKIEELEKLIEITRDIFNVDRNAMYLYLLKAYCKQDDASKALSVWTSLQEENVQPSDEFMIHLGNFLKAKDMEVPFVIPTLKTTPDLPESNVMKMGKAGQKQSILELNPVSAELRKYLANEELDKALEMKQRLESEGRSLTMSDTSQLILKMAQAERLGEAGRLVEQMLQNGMHPNPRILKYYVGKLAAGGEIDALIKLDSVLNSDLKRIAMLNSRLCVAYVEAGRGREYFEKHIKERIEEQKKYSGEPLDLNEMIPISAGTLVLRRHPELFPEFEALVPEIKDEKNRRNLHNILWIYHLINKSIDKSQEILNSCFTSGDLEQLKFYPVIAEAKMQKDEELAKELAKQILPLTHLSVSSKGYLICGVLDVLCDLGKPEEALAYLDNHLNKTVQMTDLVFSIVHKLKNRLESNNQKFPFLIPDKPPRKRRGVKDESSDSSSDSDKD